MWLNGLIFEFELQVNQVATDYSSKHEKKSRILNHCRQLLKINQKVKVRGWRYSQNRKYDRSHRKLVLVPKHLREDFLANTQKFTAESALRKIRGRTWTYSHINQMINVSNKTVKLALQSRNVNDNCINRQPRMPNIKNLQNWI